MSGWPQTALSVVSCVGWLLRLTNFGVMDFYRLKNLQADTDMRRGLGGGERGDAPGGRPSSGS